MISETGPDHRKQFEVTVSSEGRILGRGTGGSKKNAEKSAAREAIQLLREEIEELEMRWMELADLS